MVGEVSAGLCGGSSPGTILLHVVSHPSTGKCGLAHTMSRVRDQESERKHHGLKASDKAIPDSRGRGVDATSPWEEHIVST